jgi:hypothetical protein
MATSLQAIENAGRSWEDQWRITGLRGATRLTAAPEYSISDKTCQVFLACPGVLVAGVLSWPASMTQDFRS